MSAPLLCPHCRAVLVVLPGRWAMRRVVSDGERIRTGHAGIVCHVLRDPRGRPVGGCGTRWEIAPTETVRPVLARVA